MRAITIGTLLFLVAGIAEVARAAAEPVVSLAPSKITVTGISPGAEVLFFVVGFEPKGYYAVVHRWSAVVADDDGDGIVSYDLQPQVTWNARWIVADLRSGHHAVASTPGFSVAASQQARREFKRDTAGAINRFAVSHSAIDFLYVRPGGAWTLQGRDGESSDGDGRVDGETTIDVTSARSLVAGTDAPRAFTPGGTLFVIDSSRLDLLELKIDGSVLAGVH